MPTDERPIIERNTLAENAASLGPLLLGVAGLGLKILNIDSAGEAAMYLAAGSATVGALFHLGRETLGFNANNPTRHVYSNLFANFVAVLPAAANFIGII